MRALTSVRPPANDIESPSARTSADASTEWQKPDANIAGRLRFESFLLELSAFFAKASTDFIERAVDLWLEKLARFIDVDRVALWECDADGSQMPFGTSTSLRIFRRFRPKSSQLIFHG